MNVVDTLFKEWFDKVFTKEHKQFVEMCRLSNMDDDLILKGYHKLYPAQKKHTIQSLRTFAEQHRDKLYLTTKVK